MKNTEENTNVETREIKNGREREEKKSRKLMNFFIEDYSKEILRK